MGAGTNHRPTIREGCTLDFHLRPMRLEERLSLRKWELRRSLILPDSPFEEGNKRDTSRSRKAKAQGRKRQHANKRTCPVYLPSWSRGDFGPDIPRGLRLAHGKPGDSTRTNFQVSKSCRLPAPFPTSKRGPTPNPTAVLSQFIQNAQQFLYLVFGLRAGATP